MDYKVTITCCSAIAIMLLLSACAGTPKISTWSSPNTVTLEQVYNAAMIAGTDNGFTVYNQDRSSGLISLKKEAYAGDKMVDHRMALRLSQLAKK